MANHVNIDSNWFLNVTTDSATSVPSLRINGVLKNCPGDFEVREIYEFHSLSPERALSSSQSKKRARQSAAKEGTGDINDRGSLELEPLSPELRRRIEALSQWYRHIDTSVTTGMLQPVVIENITCKEVRAQIRRMISQQFPLLKVENKVEDKNESEVPGASSLSLIISPDDCIFSALRAQGMSTDDIESIHRYYRRGAGDESAGHGVRVGANLSRESRGACFQILRSKMPSLDSKTVDIQAPKWRKTDNSTDPPSDGTSQGKVMLIHWTKKATHNAHRRDNSSVSINTAESKTADISEQSAAALVERQSDTVGTLFLSFTLMKHNMEQMHAVQLIAEAVGVSPAEISVAGVKDKLAVTFQQACLRVHYDGVNARPCTVNDDFLPSNCVLLASDDSSGQTTASHKNLVTAAIKHWDNDALQGPVPGARVVNWTEFRQQVPRAAHSALARVLQSLAQFTMPPRIDAESSTSTDWKPFFLINQFYLRSAALSTGELWGNQFAIRIRSPSITNISVGGIADSNISSLHGTVQCSLQTIGTYGFPNFYGSQRMGYAVGKVQSVERDWDKHLTMLGIHNQPSSLPPGPMIGRLLLTGNFDAAIHMIVLDSLAATDNSAGDGEIVEPVASTEVNDSEIPEAGQAEQAISKSRDTSGWDREAHRQTLLQGQQMYLSLVSSHKVMVKSTADSQIGQQLRAILKLIPHSATRARMVLRAMIRYGYSFCQPTAHTGSTDTGSMQMRILQQLPHSVRSLWVSAYQSWLWNRAAWHRLSAYNSGGGEVMTGDLLLTGAVGDRAEAMTVVREEQLAEWSPAERRAKLAQVVLPLVGTKMQYPSNESGVFYKALLRQEGLLITGGTPEQPDEILDPAFSSFAPRGAYRTILVCIHVYSQRFVNVISSNTFCLFLSKQSVQDASVCTKRFSDPGTDVTVEGDSQDMIDESVFLELQFKLPAGSYATSFLRQLLRNDNMI